MTLLISAYNQFFIDDLELYEYKLNFISKTHIFKSQVTVIFIRNIFLIIFTLGTAGINSPGLNGLGVNRCACMFG